VGCGKPAMEKVEDHLVRAAVSCEKLCAVGEISVIPLNVCGTVYIIKYSYIPNMFTILHVNGFFRKKNIKFSKFFIHMVHINRTIAIAQAKGHT
jgi:hypothetical protein